MSYRTHAVMARNESLMQRFTAAAATEGIPQASTWVQQNMLYMVKADAIAAWDKALAAASSDDGDPDKAIDMGLDESVVTDQMILSAVQARKAELEPAA